MTQAIHVSHNRCVLRNIYPHDNDNLKIWCDCTYLKITDLKINIIDEVTVVITKYHEFWFTIYFLLYENIINVLYKNKKDVSTVDSILTTIYQRTNWVGITTTLLCIPVI